MPNRLTIVDKYPAEDASGVYINDIVWAQFSEPISSGTATYYNFSVSERDTYDPVDGRTEVHGVSGHINNAVVLFIPTTGFKRSTEYAVIVSTEISSSDGSKTLDHDVVWYFETGTTASSGTIGSSIYGLDPSGFTADTSGSTVDPTATGVIGTPLEVVSTFPADFGTDNTLDLKYIKISFNDTLPTGVIDLTDHISVTSKLVLT